MGHYRRFTALGLSLCWAAIAGPTWGAQGRKPNEEPPVLRLTEPSVATSQLVDIRNKIDGEIEIILRRGKLLSTKVDVLRVAIGDTSVVDVAQLDVREMQLIGKEPGTTTLTLWLGDPGQQPEIFTYLVTVTPDPGIQQLRKTQYRELEAMVNELFPNSKVRLIPVADKLVVRGQARDAQEAAQIMAVIRGQAVDATGAPGQWSGGINQGQAAAVYPEAGIAPSNIVNMLRVPGEQQVMLKVRIAELSRTALRELGMDFSARTGNVFFSSILSGQANIVATFDNGDVQTMIHALEKHGVLKMLAEPNLVTLSGHTASFIAGGRFAVPTVVGVGGAEAATTTFQGFGTLLTFTPTVLDKDRIRLAVAPEFSSINADLSVNGIPGLNTRSAYTTVDIREGQVLAIAGLLSDRQVGTNTRVPLLGRLPVIGAAFSSKSVTRDETELLVLVSPEIVHPMDPDEVPYVLPGTDVTEPRDCDLYAHGRLEGNPDENFRSTVWPEYRKQVEAARHRTNKNGWIAYPAEHGIDPMMDGQPYDHPQDVHMMAAAPSNGPTTLVTGKTAASSGAAKQPASPPTETRRAAVDRSVRPTSGFRPISQGQSPEGRAGENRYMAGPRGFSD